MNKAQKLILIDAFVILILMGILYWVPTINVFISCVSWASINFALTFFQLGSKYERL